MPPNTPWGFGGGLDWARVRFVGACMTGGTDFGFLAKAVPPLGCDACCCGAASGVRSWGAGVVNEASASDAIRSGTTRYRFGVAAWIGACSTTASAGGVVDGVVSAVASVSVVTAGAVAAASG